MRYTTYNTSKLIERDVFEIKNKIKNKDRFFLYTGRGTCPWCKKFMYYLNEIIDEDNIDIYYLDSQDTMIDSDLKSFRDIYNIKYVPSLIYFWGTSYKVIELNITNEEFNKAYLNNKIKEVL